MYVLLWRSLAKDHLSSENSAQTCIALYLRSCPLTNFQRLHLMRLYSTKLGKVELNFSAPHSEAYRPVSILVLCSYETRMNSSKWTMCYVVQVVLLWKRGEKHRRKPVSRQIKKLKNTRPYEVWHLQYLSTRFVY